MATTQRLMALTATGWLAISMLALPANASVAPERTTSSGAAGAALSGRDGLSVSFSLTQSMSQQAAVKRAAGHVRGDLAALRSGTPPVSERDAVTNWASSHFFRVTHSSRFVVTVTGGADALAAAMGTHLATVAQNHTTYTMATSRLVIPAELTNSVSSLVGLDNRPVFTSRVAYTPTDLRAINKDPVVDLAAGAGVTVGTVNLSGWYSSDLTKWASDPNGDGNISDGINIAPGQISQISLNGFDTTDVSSGGEAEVALDAETILGVAPSAKQRMYFADNTASGMLALYDQMANDAQTGLLQVASSSWGLCETQMDGNLMQGVGSAIDRMLAAGSTFFSASGDAGSYDCSTQSAVDNRLSVDFPASYPNTVAVGGTTTTPDSAGGYSHVAWGPVNPTLNPSPNLFQGNASGGGFSSTYASPTWQAQGSRAVPDISDVGDPATGYITVTDGTYTLTGGTSLASPMSAAGLATALSVTGKTSGLGNILPLLYSHQGLFADVIGNSNGYYTAGMGYDEVTGLGVLDWNAFATLVRGGSTATLSASPTVGTTQAPVSGSSYHAVAPYRVLDSRNGTGTTGPIPSHGSITVQITGGASPVPAGATSAALNVTALGSTSPGFLSVAPQQSTTTSNLNFVAGQTIPNLVISQLAADGTVTLYNGASSPVSVIADIQGFHM